MAYDRALALKKLRFSYEDIMIWADRIVPVEEDPDYGYGMMLDSAFAQYGAEPVAAEDYTHFDDLLNYHATRMLLPIVCSMADAQVDAPLTKVNGSQVCRQYQQNMAVLTPKIDAVYDAGTEYAGGYTFIGNALEPYCPDITEGM